MKDVPLLSWLLLLFCSAGFAQGTDVIIWVDNSSSISTSEYTLIKEKIQSIVHNVLLCNPANRVAVVQYGGTSIARIYIESDFTTSELIANNFSNRSGIIGSSDYAHECLLLIDKALNNTYDPYIMSPQTTLNHISTNSLAVYLLTDAARNGSVTFLVNKFSTTPNTNDAFVNYTNFKNNWNAKFIVTHVPPTDVSKYAAAAIASKGGAYTGTVESYPADPDGPGTTPRFLITRNDFNLTASEIEQITDYICSVAEPECVADLILTVANNITTGQDNRQASNSITASNTINTNAVAIYHAKNTVVLKPGFHAKNGSRFRGYIEGCSGNFVGRMAGNENITESLEEETIMREQTVRLHPNPATSTVTVYSESNIISLTISSFQNETLFQAALKDNLKSYELDVSNYPRGIYIITIISDDGTVQTEKLLKN
jgi:hypothetical protein